MSIENYRTRTSARRMIQCRPIWIWQMQRGCKLQKIQSRYILSGIKLWLSGRTLICHTSNPISIPCRRNWSGSILCEKRGSHQNTMIKNCGPVSLKSYSLGRQPKNSIVDSMGYQVRERNSVVYRFYY